MKKFRLPIAFKGQRVKVECHYPSDKSEFIEMMWKPELLLPDNVRTLTITDSVIKSSGGLGISQQACVKVCK